MKRTFQLIFTISLFTAFLSCNTLYNVQTIPIEIVEPATLILPAKYKKLAIRYNNCNADINPNFQTYMYTDTQLNDLENTDSIASEVYYETTVNQLKEQYFFDSIMEVEAQYFKNIKIIDSISYPFLNKDSFLIDSSINQQYNVYRFSEAIKGLRDLEKEDALEKHLHPQYALYEPQELKEIADSTDADLLLSLDYYASMDGIFFAEEIYKASEIVAIDAIWNFYDLKTLKYLHFKQMGDTIRWDKYAENPAVIDKLLPPRKDAVLNAADIAGTNFANYVVPHWIEVERMYYVSGHVELKKTQALIEQGKWLEAAEIWKEQANNPNKNIAAKCKFNMALACEMQGNIDAALAWVVESFHVFGQKNLEHYYNCHEYIRILGQRKLDLKRIENQFEETN